MVKGDFASIVICVRKNRALKCEPPTIADAIVGSSSFDSDKLAGVSDGSASGQQLNDKNNQCHDQQQVNQTAAHMSDSTQHPQHHQNY